MRREPTVWENIFANDISDEGLISNIYKELTGLHSRKTDFCFLSHVKVMSDSALLESIKVLGVFTCYQTSQAPSGMFFFTKLP